MKRLRILFALLIFLVPSHVLAPLSITMAPPRKEFFMGGKKKAQEVIEIENKGYQPVRLKVYVSGFTIDEKGSLAFSSSDRSAEEWIKVKPTELTIQPYDYNMVRYEVKVPDGAKDGSYTASIMIEEIPPPDSDESRTHFLIKGRMAHIIYVNLGNPEYSCQVEWFKMERKEGQLAFIFCLKNEGDFCFRTHGSISILGKDEKNRKEVAVPDLPVLPRSKRIIEVMTPSYDLPEDTYTASLSIDIGAKSRIQAISEFAIPGNR